MVAPSELRGSGVPLVNERQQTAKPRICSQLLIEASPADVIKSPHAIYTQDYPAGICVRQELQQVNHSICSGSVAQAKVSRSSCVPEILLELPSHCLGH
eukprot:3114588-Karenia_brevis.AAC.1